MLKLIGGILVAGSGVGLAVSMIGEIRQHLQRLYEIRQLLLNISGEEALALLPMEHILDKPGLTKDAALQKVCREIAESLAAKKEGSGSEIWREAFWKNQKELGLHAAELEITANAGTAFFGRNIKENEKMLHGGRRGQEHRAGLSQKVAGTVSVIGGMMLVILLI